MVETYGGHRTFFDITRTRTFARLKRLSMTLGIIVALVCSTYIGGYIAALMYYEDLQSYSYSGTLVQPTLWDYTLVPGQWVMAFLIGIMLIAICSGVCYGLYHLARWIWFGESY